MRASHRGNAGLVMCGALALMNGGCKAREAAAPAPPAVSAAAAPGQRLNTGEPVDGEATVSAPATVGVGASFEAGWTGPGNSGDYIDLVPRGATTTSGEITYAYTRDAIPAAKLVAPTTPGEYDVRYVLQLAGERRIKATAPLAVTAVRASLTVPDSAEAAEPLSIEWTGPGGQGDYIDIVPAGYSLTSGEITYAYTREGTPAKLTAPGKPGGYQVRYLLEGPGGRKILASSPLVVRQPSATLTAPESAVTGSKIKVTWTGPRRRGDYVDLVKLGHSETSGELSYFYTDRESSSELTAPAEAGEYEIRYVLEAPGGRQVLARRVIHIR